jgi:hypothetical protein
VRALVFALRFRGRGVEVAPGRRRGATTAQSQLFRTTLAAAGVEGRVESLGGETATLEAEVELTGSGTFVESGWIRYGAAGSLTFRTVGHGVRGPSGIPGRVMGAVIWEVTGGDGAFAGATGLITSNFTVETTGEVVDDQIAQLVLPDGGQALASWQSAAPGRGGLPFVKK